MNNHVTTIRLPIASALFVLLSLVTGCTGIVPGSIDDLGVQYDQFLGKPIEERIKVAGMPDSCLDLKNGGQVCEWLSYRWVGSLTFSHKRTFFYGANGLACGWTYDGAAGHRTVDKCEDTGEKMPDTSI